MIRLATLADHEAIVQGNIAMAQETEDLTLDPAIVRPGVQAVLSGQRVGQYYVGLDGDRVVSQLMITFEWSDWRNADVWWIQSVYVVPDHRRRGWYRRLYAYVQAQARAEGAAGLRLYVDKRNTPAQAVYTRLGMNGEHYATFEAMFDTE